MRPWTFLEMLFRIDDVVLDDVIAKDDANLFAFHKRLGQTQGVGDAAFAFLVGVMDRCRPKFLPFESNRKKSPEFCPPVTTMMSRMPASTSVWIG